MCAAVTTEPMSENSSVAIGAGPWSASGEPAMSGQLVNWMHRVLPFSKNTRSPQHCNAAAYDHASSNASSRNASPLHCASSPARNRATAEAAASANPEHPVPQHEVKELLEAERAEDDLGGGYVPLVAQMQDDELPPPPPPPSSGEQRRHGPSSRGMDSVEFRQRGREMVEYIARYMETICDRRVTPQCEPGYLKELLPERAPEQPEDWDNIMADVERFIMPGVTHWQHPPLPCLLPRWEFLPFYPGGHAL
ncbi:hypothetical protein MTO96_016411 [Rhipicephalus appendiculatus]